MSGSRVWEECDGGSLRSIGFEEGFRACPCSVEPGVVFFFEARVADDGDLEHRLGHVGFVDIAPFPGGEGVARPEPDGDDAVGVGGLHQARPGTAAGVTPEAPGDRGQFGVVGLLGEVA